MTANGNLKRRVRARAAKTGKRFTEARTDVLKIFKRMDEAGATYEEAEAWFDNPADQ